MIEFINIIQFGCMGILGYVVYKGTEYIPKMTGVISNNTVALNKLSLLIELYHKNK